MVFEDIYVVSDRLDVVTDDDVTTAEVMLGAHFPDGYRQYITTFGEGYCNEYIHVYTPSDIVANKLEFQERWAKFAAGRYKVGLDLLPLPTIVESIILFDTPDGDEIVFHADRINELYVLPRYNAQIYKVGDTLNEAIMWVLQSNILLPRDSTSVLGPSGYFIDRPIRYFEPSGYREYIASVQFWATSYVEARAHLLALARDKPEEVICVRHMEMQGDSIESEWLQLFVKELGGAVECNRFGETQQGVSIRINYDIDRRGQALGILSKSRGLGRRERHGGVGLSRALGDEDGQGGHAMGAGETVV